MSARSILGVTAAMFGLLGLTAGIVEWSMIVVFASDSSFANLCWLAQIIFYGGGLILGGFAVAMDAPAPKGAQVGPAVTAEPPRMPTQPVQQVSPVAREKEPKEDLWQSADAPFPAPPNIERPTDGPSLWQSNQAPFPKVEVPEDEAEEGESKRES